jgi:acetyl-CoA carboxylase, biotin carboxylase subunit
MSKKVLVANRGEIAVRVIRCCKVMDIPVVSVYTEADKDSLHVSLADESIFMEDRRGYLNGDTLIALAKETGCDAVHPGYGFLAENAEFADKCKESGLIFIGPSAKSIEAMGLKLEARKLMQDSGVPVVPGSGLIESIESGLAEAEAIGYPVMIKASAGGGGRGIRVAMNKEQFCELLPAAQKESEVAFGSSEVYLEKYFDKPRHIEIQVIGDHFGNIIHMGERECSIQRRRQKLLEESPSPVMNEALRDKMGSAAVRAAQTVGYYGCGTVEFLVDEEMNYYFLEMNTRIQVEHPVTEMVTGFDLIKEQIKIAYGEPLSIKQQDITLKGWSIECRINAEDHEKNFKPTPGLIERFYPPMGPWSRMDTYLVEGIKITPLFDSLIGKVIVWGHDRKEAISRMRLALDEMVIDGVPTTAPVLRKLLDDEEFIAGRFDNNYLEKWLKTIL